MLLFDSVNEPVPVLVRLPPAMPEITPANVVVTALLPPVVSTLAPRFTPVLTVPASEPISSLPSNDRMPVPVSPTADPFGIAVPPCTCSVPAVIDVAPS